MAREDRQLNVAGPDQLSRSVARRTWLKGAGLLLAAAGAAPALGACDSSTRQSRTTTLPDGGSVPPVEPEAEKELNFFNWTSYIDDESTAPDTPPDERTIARFERETAISVNYQTYGGNEELLEKLSGGNSGFDIVVPSDYVVERMIAANMLRRLDRAAIPNFYDNQADSFKGLYYDPDNEYSVPWGSGNSGIGVNKEAVTQVVADASVFGDASYKGMMSLLDDFRATIPLALFHLGLDPTSGNAADLDRAFAQLAEWKQNAVVTSDYQDSLGSGDLVVSHAYSGDVVQQGAATGMDLQYVVPPQGADKYVDSMVVPADAPHPGNAHLFMDYVYEPDVSAQLMAATRYRNANQAAYELLPPALRDNQIVFPPKDVEDRLVFIQLDPETAATWKDRWSRFVAS